jgi:hypothetical protein
MNNRQQQKNLMDKAKEAIKNNDRKEGLIIYQALNASPLYYIQIIINDEHRKTLKMLCAMIEVESYKEKQKHTKQKPL